MNLQNRTLRIADFTASYNEEVLPDEKTTTSLDEANVVCSDVPGSVQCSRPCCHYERSHFPVIDLDVPANLVRSSTPGHSHLYIDHKITWAQYCTLLDALASCGIIELGYVTATKRRGYSTVRLPWIRKGMGDRGGIT